MNSLNPFIVIVALLSSITAIAQNTLSGNLFDTETKEPIVGATIKIKGSAESVVSNASGKFTINSVRETDSLEICAKRYPCITVKADQETVGSIGMEMSANNLQEVIVTASRQEQNRSDAPISISTISATTIKDAKPTSIDQVLNKVSGVYMVNLGNEQHAMAIRQPLGYKSLFLYLEDGVPIRTSGLFNHNALIEINMATVKNIEVIRGPASSLYGQEAIGGAVNFITQSPGIIPMTKVSVQGNNLGYRRTDLQASNTFNKLGLSIAGYYAVRKNGFMEHSDFTKLGLTLRADYNINDKTVLNNSVSFVDYYSDMTGSLDSTKFVEHNYKNLHTFTYRNVAALRAKSALTRIWNSNSKTTITAIYRNNSIKQNPSYSVADDYKPWSGKGNPLLAHGQINDVYFQSYAAVLQHKQSFNWKNAAIIGGASADFSPSGYYAKYIRINKDEDGQYVDYQTSDSLLSDYNVKVMNYAAYVQAEASPIKNLRLVAASRFDNFVYTFDNALAPSSFSGSPDSKNTFNAFSPKAGFTYTIQQSGLYANYSQGFVPPQITELYKGVKVPLLNPSTFYNYEVGGWSSLIKNKIYLDASLYQLDGTNEIISVRLDDGTYENQNAGKTQHIGIEYGATFTPIKSIRIRFSGTNASHKFIEFNERGTDYSGKLMPNSPGFIANTEIIYKPDFLKGFRIGVEFQHLDSYYMDSKNTVKYPGFDIWNLRLGYEWRGIETWVNWLNATNVHYATIANKSQWGYSYSLGDPSNLNIGLSYKISGKKK